MNKVVNAVLHVVITPVKNEKNIIQGCIDSMMSQSILPKLWIIIDDNSTDGTDTIIENAIIKYSNIRIIKSEIMANNRKRGKNIANMFLQAFELIDFDWDFCSKIDSDILLEKNYFELLFSKFKQEPLLGIASGNCNIINGTKFKLEKVSPDHTRGALKTYKSECYYQIGGVRPVDGWDGIDNIMAQMHGWQTKNFQDILTIHLRNTGSYNGILSGSFENGKFAYFMGYHPLFMAARSAHKFISPPYLVGGVALFMGYMTSFISKKPIYQDKEVVNFLRKKQLKKMRLKR